MRNEKRQMKKVYVQAGRSAGKAVSKRLRKRYSVPLWLLLVLIVVPAFCDKFPDPSTRVGAGAQEPDVAEPTVRQAQYDCQVSPVFPPSVLQWSEYICVAAHEFSIEPNVIAALMQWESGGDMWAVSRADARGLMQVMPFNFGIKADGHYSQKQVEKMHAPLSNIRHGCMYLRKCLDASALKGKGLWTALAAYNGGITNVIQKGHYFNESIRLANGVSHLLKGKGE